MQFRAIIIASRYTYRTSGEITGIAGDRITFNHEAVPALKWPAMTMTFRLGAPALARGFKKGDRVAFSFDQTANGPVIRTLRREVGQ